MNEKLKKVIENKEYENAVDIVHKIKSSSGSIGADKLYNTAIQLQKALKENNKKEINKLLSIFSKQLKELLETIKKI